MLPSTPSVLSEFADSQATKERFCLISATEPIFFTAAGRWSLSELNKRRLSWFFIGKWLRERKEEILVV